MRFKWVLFFIFFTLLPVASWADTHEAASVSRADVLIAYNLCSNGDTLSIPSGTAQWDTAITMAKELIIQGAGIDITTIERNGFSISNTDNWRITGITFNGEDQSIRPLYIETCKNFRIDHIKVYDYASQAAYIKGYSYGLIDNSQFIDCAGEIITIFGDGSTAWGRSEKVGQYTTGVIFIEDCTFTQATRSCYNVIDSNNGARWVFRYNTVNSNSGGGFAAAVLENHGCCVTGVPRGTVSVEIYENTINDNGGSFAETGFKIRGGRGVIYNNTINDSWNQMVKIYNYRSMQACFDGHQCGDKEPCGTLGNCASGYPCTDQINNFYIWGNTSNIGSDNRVTLDSSGCSSAHIQEGRDFFVSEMRGYTPYTYPHPLREWKLQEPQNLRVIE
ncbi:MAG: hypothetical protein J7L73_05290 [Anaerolineales bacterium]|nr:hypothetical protein [Anaerolineales bacterium]